MMDYFDKISSRERWLAIVTMSLLCIGAGMYVTVSARGYLISLDKQIDDYELRHLNMKHLAATSESIRRAFSEVAAEHSSAWTEAQIRDRLRKELNKLAVGTVQIPELSGGGLKEGGDGYREYEITINVPTTKIRSLVGFLERLRSSRQSLRIDTLDMARGLSSTDLSVKIGVTRTVADILPGTVEEEVVESIVLLSNPSFEEWDEANSEFKDWEKQGSTVSQVVEYSTLDSNCMKISADRDGSSVSYSVSLESGKRYELQADITAFGTAMINISDVHTGTPFAGGQEIKNDGRTYRYSLQFNVPENDLGHVILRAPEFVLKERDCEVYVDNIVLRKAEE